jgi:hypothetical protein
MHYGTIRFTFKTSPESVTVVIGTVGKEDILFFFNISRNTSINMLKNIDNSLPYLSHRFERHFQSIKHKLFAYWLFSAKHNGERYKIPSMIKLI